MALTPLTTPAWLKGWQSTGLGFLLAEIPLAELRLRASQAGENTQAVMVPGACVSVQHSVSGSAALPASPRLSTQPPTAGPSQERGQQSMSDNAATVPLQSASPSATATESVDWPSNWAACMEKTRSAPILWAYRELSLDLVGQGEKQRGDLFRKLLGELRLPRGTSTFWPTAMSEEGTFAPNLPVFWAGVRRLKPRICVVFGQDSLSDVYNGHLPVYQQEIVGGRLLAHMPALTTLISDSDAYRRSLSFVRALVTPYLD